MKTERAFELIKNMGWEHIGCGGIHANSRPPFPRMTQEEEEIIKAKWKRMPGNTSFYDATVAITRGE